MTRIALFVIGVMVGSIGMLAQAPVPQPPPPLALEPGASQADVDKALDRRAGQSEGPGDGGQVETGFHLRHAAQGHEPAGVLRPLRVSRSSSRSRCSAPAWPISNG